MKIELGKQYTTRSGRKVKLITIDFDHPDYKVVGCVGDRTSTTSWTSTGRFYASGDISDNDLIESDKAMKIELDKKYKISNGQYVTIVTTKGRQPFPIAGYIGDSNDLRTWRDNGKFYEKEFDDTSLDLIEVGEYDDIKIDDPVLVSIDNVKWHKMHFAGIAENGKPTTFYSGRTSYSNGNNDKPAWDFCKKNDEK